MDMLILAAHLSGAGLRLQHKGQSMQSLGLALLAVALVVGILELASP
jgi:hypothetical protein